MKVCVLTTSYPRHPGDVAGRLRRRTRSSTCATAGVEVDVVSPASFRHFGIAYGDGIANNLRARPWRVLLLPLFLLSFARAARRGAARRRRRARALAAVGRRRPRDAASRSSSRRGGRTSSSRKRLPWLFRPLLRRARIVVCASSALAADVRALGARRRARDPERRRRSRRGRPAGRAAARPLRRAALGGEGHPRARRGGRRACRSSSSATGRCATSCRRRVGFVAARRARRLLRARRGRRACRRAARATASSPARRWRTAGRSSRPASAASPTRSTTASPGSSSRPATSRALRAALERLLADARAAARGSGLPRGRRRCAECGVACGDGGDAAAYADAIASTRRR